MSVPDPTNQPPPSEHSEAATADGSRAFGPATAPTAPESWDRPGLVIGHYKLLTLLGEGGFGVVYLAEQSAPVRRKVALKVLKPGMDSRHVLARFGAERQALAIMDHPNVARVFDAGATPEGRPYFVMEYVAGEPVTAHADRRRLSTRDRLSLFRGVCAGVQHAHQKGLIHRDIKPSNVLVVEHDGVATPKVIDFGVAKAMSQPLTDRTLHTERGQIVGTIEYMSPEQAGGAVGADVDTRADVYSLGVLLYELLTGRLPFDSATLRRAGPTELERIIREVDPPRPSTRIAQAGESAETLSTRGAEPERVSRELRGDLDWITMKAMEKDRSRRYASASDLMADLDRHLRNEPVTAGPPSARYRARKFVRRNRVAVGAAGVLAAGGAVAFGGLAYGLVEAERQRARAVAAADEATAVNDFLNEMLRAADPNLVGGGGRGVTVRAVLDGAAAQVGARFADPPRPGVEARVRATIGDSYLGLGEFEAAEAQLRAALAIFERLHGPADRRTITALNSLATAVQGRGDVQGAEALFRSALEGGRAALGELDPDTLAAAGNLALVLYTQGKGDEAIGLTRRAMEGQERALGGDDPRTLDTVTNLAAMLHGRSRYAEAEPLSRRAVEAWTRVGGRDHPKTLVALNNLGTLLFDLGRTAEVEPIYRDVLEASRRVLGAEHPDTVTSEANLAGLLLNLGKTEEAEGVYRAVHAMRAKVQGSGHPDAVHNDVEWAIALRALGRWEEAEAVLRAALEAGRANLGPEAPDTLSAEGALGEVLLRRGEGAYAEAEALLRHAAAAAERTMDDSAWQRGGLRRGWANSLRKLGRLEEAETEALAAHAFLSRLLGAEHKQARLTAQVLAWVKEAAGDEAGAAEWRGRMGEGLAEDGR